MSELEICKATKNYPEGPLEKIQNQCHKVNKHLFISGVLVVITAIILAVFPIYTTTPNETYIYYALLTICALSLGVSVFYVIKEYIILRKYL